MKININGNLVEIKKGLKLRFLGDKIGEVTSKAPWQSESGVIKFEAKIDDELLTVRESHILGIVENKITKRFSTDDSLDSENNSYQREVYNKLKSLSKITEDIKEKETEDSEILELPAEELSKNKDNKKVDKTEEIEPMFSLIPQAALLEVAKVMASKSYNYSENKKVTTYINNALVSINKFLMNEDIDNETKTNHIAIAISNLMIILDSIIIKKSTDDRNKSY
jgi:hypothetical protein